MASENGLKIAVIIAKLSKPYATNRFAAETEEKHESAPDFGQSKTTINFSKLPEYLHGAAACSAFTALSHRALVKAKFYK